jgi:hypothetical protein
MIARIFTKFWLLILLQSRHQKEHFLYLTFHLRPWQRVQIKVLCGTSNAFCRLTPGLRLHKIVNTLKNTRLIGSKHLSQ